MAKTTSQLDPAQALSLQNLIAKNEKQLELIYYAYIDQFSGSHITTKDEFVSFIRNYKIWREQMLRALPVIIAHIEKERSLHTDWEEEVEKRLRDAGEFSERNKQLIFGLVNYTPTMLMALQNHSGSITYDAYSLEVNNGLELFIKLFGTGEKTKTTKGKPAGSGAAAGSTTSGGAFSVGNRVITIREIEVFTDSSGKLLFDREVPQNTQGIISKGPIKVNNDIYYLILFDLYSRGWVNELDLTNANSSPAASSSGTSTSTSPTSASTPSQPKAQPRRFPSIPNPFKRKATATPQPPPIPKASARTSRLTGTGPRMRINLMPTPPPKKPWWKVW